MDRSLLWHKLLKEKVSSKLVKAVCSMYRVVKSCVRYQSSTSRFFNSYICLKQGDPSSQLMCMMFINDIVQNIRDNFDEIFTVNELRLFILLYADDAIIFAKSPKVLQSLLHDLEVCWISVGLKSLLHQGLSEPEFYGDLVYKFKNIVGRADFSDQFTKIIVRYKRIGYNINIMQQSACLVFNPITVNNFASLFNCTPVGRASDSMTAQT